MGGIDRSRAMMRSLWISKTGMEAQQTQLDNISNNLANVSTNGYKRRGRCSRT
jgi:flagellar basal body rod protein FlgG